MKIKVEKNFAVTAHLIPAIFKTMTGITLTYLEKIQEERKDNLRAYQQK